MIGARVIAAAGSDERVRLGLDLGADHGINYNTQDIRAEAMTHHRRQGRRRALRQHRQPEGAAARRSWRIGMHGRLVTAGAHGGPEVTINFSHLYHKRITIKGTPGYHPPDVPKCFAAVAAGQGRSPQIERVLPLSRAAEAHRLVESGAAQGKIVLDPTLG